MLDRMNCPSVSLYTIRIQTELGVELLVPKQDVNIRTFHRVTLMWWKPLFCMAALQQYRHVGGGRIGFFVTTFQQGHLTED